MGGSDGYTKSIQYKKNVYGILHDWQLLFEYRLYSMGQAQYFTNYADTYGEVVYRGLFTMKKYTVLPVFLILLIFFAAMTGVGFVLKAEVVWGHRPGSATVCRRALSCVLCA